MFFGRSISAMLIGAVTILISITVHELAHGYAAYRLGDQTAKIQGRLTLNPLAHLDPIGALLMFITGFGWAKPVPVNPFFFKGDRTKGMMLVSIAGPLANLVLAWILICVYIGAILVTSTVYPILHTLALLNIYLAVFNLIPIPPLDGSKILAGFLPKQTALKYLTTVEQYGFLILMLLVIVGLVPKVVAPLAAGIYNLMVVPFYFFI